MYSGSPASSTGPVKIWALTLPLKIDSSRIYALDALPDLLVLVETGVLRRAIGPVAGIGRRLQRHDRRWTEFEVLAPGQMATVEIVRRVVPALDLIFRQDARIAPPDVARPAHLVAIRERNVGGAVDRKPPRRMHDDAEIVVVQHVLVGADRLDQRRGFFRQRIGEFGQADALGPAAEKVGLKPLALGVVVIERRIEPRGLLGLLRRLLGDHKTLAEATERLPPGTTRPSANT